MISQSDSNDIHSILHKLIPSGVTSYISRSAIRDTTRLILSDWDQTIKYFEKEYSCELTQAQLIAEVLEDMHKFNDYWNSPLMKALT